MKFTANAVRQKKRKRVYILGKEEIKLPLFTGDMIIYVENMKQKELLEINKQSRQ